MNLWLSIGYGCIALIFFYAASRLVSAAWYRSKREMEHPNGKE